MDTFPGQLQRIHIFHFLAGRKTNFKAQPVPVAHPCISTSSRKMCWRKDVSERLSELLHALAPLSSDISSSHWFNTMSSHTAVHGPLYSYQRNPSRVLQISTKTLSWPLVL